jgi:hypothetical protein
LNTFKKEKAVAPKFWMYIFYLVITIGLTVWVARTLFRNGQVFLRDALASEELATAVNRLLQVGFYLINLGYVALFMKTTDTIYDATGAMETGAWKLGVIMLALGLMHLLNIFVLNRFRRRFQHQNLDRLTPPPPRPPRFSPEPPTLAAPQ